MPDNPLSKLQKLKAQHAAITARIQQLEARDREASRKQDTRRKIIVGGSILAAIATNPDLAGLVRAELTARVTKPQDRALLSDLLG